MLTFMVIIYQLSIKNINFLKIIFPNMTTFLICFAAVYIPITILIGWQDIKKGSFPLESRISFDKNPRLSEMYELIKNIDKRLHTIENNLRNAANLNNDKGRKNKNRNLRIR